MSHLPQVFRKSASAEQDDSAPTSRLLVFALLLCVIAASAPSRPPSATAEAAMRIKLRCAQGVLEGITAEDFPAILTNAVTLRRMSDTSDWRVRGTPEYERLTSDYDRAAEALERAARLRSVDAATLAYFQLTTSCVACHKYLRGTEAVRSGPAPPLRNSASKTKSEAAAENR